MTTLNLTVVKVDAERNLIAIKGAVPGPTGGLVIRAQCRQGCLTGLAPH